MKNLCIIPARGGSKRIPRKNIKDFLGKPIIAYSIEAALKSGMYDEVIHYLTWLKDTFKLDEFDEGMEQAYLISDDFRAQVKQMKSLFQELLEEMQYQAEIIRMDMIAAKEGSYGEE